VHHRDGEAFALALVRGAEGVPCPDHALALAVGEPGADGERPERTRLVVRREGGELAAARDAAAVAIRKYSATHRRDRVTLVKILKAEQQVVAGMNYRLCMTVKNQRGLRRTVTAVVYETPNGFMRSTSWSTGGCKEL
jgi:hypothetical protein